MKLTPQIEKAIKKASVLHRNQVRKKDGTPYISHLFSVAWILSNYTDDEDIIVAGILHDTIEDTDYKVEELENDFGSKIKTIVLGVTEDANIKDWLERKKDYLETMERDGFESLMVCAADKLHNLMSVDFNFNIYGKGIWSQISGAPSPEIYFWYHGESLKILKEKLKNPIVDELEKQYTETHGIMLK